MTNRTTLPSDSITVVTKSLKPTSPALPKYLSISSLQNSYLNLDRRSGCGRNSERANIVQTKCNFCGGAHHYAENVSYVSEGKRKNLVQLVIRTTEVRNACLGNVLDVDMNTT